jgi:hypothetical protein
MILLLSESSATEATLGNGMWTGFAIFFDVVENDTRGDKTIA